MEGLGVLVLATIGLFIILPIWAVSTILRLRRQVQNDWQENLQHLKELKVHPPQREILTLSVIAGGRPD